MNQSTLADASVMFNAWLLLAGVAAVVLLWFTWTVWRDRGPGDTPVIALIRRVNAVYTYVFHGIRRPPDDPLPRGGPAIVVANHRSGIDPLVLNACTRRRIRFLIAREYYQITGLFMIFRKIQVIPVRRDGSDLAATRHALRALREGHVIGIFPEGGIRDKLEDSLAPEESERDEFKDGASLLALRSGAPLISAYVDGTPPNDSVLAAFFTPTRSRVVFGTPFHLPKTSGAKPTKEELRDGTRRIVDRILALRSVLRDGDPESEAGGQSEAEVLSRTKS